MTFEELYEQYQIPIYRYVYFKLDDTQQAEDVTQDVFVKAMKHLSHLQEETNYKNWLYCIATNACIDALRHRNLLHFVEMEPWYAIGDLPDVAMQEVEQAVLRHLSAHQRQALLLYYREGYSAEEIAVHIGYKPRGMKMFLKRARDAFKEQYQLLKALEEVAA